MPSPSCSTQTNKFIVHTLHDPGFKLMRDFNNNTEHTVNYHPSHFKLSEEEFQNLLKHPVVTKAVKSVGEGCVQIGGDKVTWIIRQGDLERKISKFMIPVVTNPTITCYWPTQFVIDNVPEPITMEDPRPPPPERKRKSPSMEIDEEDVIVIEDDIPPPKMIYIEDILEENQAMKLQIRTLQQQLTEQATKFEEYQKAMEKRMEKMDQRLVREIECFNQDVSDVRGEFKAGIAHIYRTAVFRESAEPAPVLSKKNLKKKKK